MPKCRYCGADIVFVRTTLGRSMPCDATLRSYREDPRGPLKIVTPDGKVISARGVAGDEAAHGVGYIPHWATCPGADQARRQGR